MAKFEEGNNDGRKFNGEIATEMQRRSAAKRRQNKTLAEMMRAALAEEAAPGMTKGEFLIRKAINNHKDGRLSFKDLKDLGAVLGESVLKVETDGPRLLVVDSETLQAAAKWSSKPETSKD